MVKIWLNEHTDQGRFCHSVDGISQAWENDSQNIPFGFITNLAFLLSSIHRPFVNYGQLQRTKHTITKLQKTSKNTPMTIEDNPQHQHLPSCHLSKKAIGNAQNGWNKGVNDQKSVVAMPWDAQYIFRFVNKSIKDWQQHPLSYYIRNVHQRQN